jgi:hypothetical protein
MRGDDVFASFASFARNIRSDIRSGVQLGRSARDRYQQRRLRQWSKIVDELDSSGARKKSP